MAITTTSDLNVELTELTSAPAPVELSAVDNIIEAATFRRAIHELESVRSGLEEPMRSELGNLISSLQSQFNISGAITPNIASALQEARGQAVQYAAIAMQNNQAALYDAIDAASSYSLSAAAAARVGSRISALQSGDRDAFFDSFIDASDPPPKEIAADVQAMRTAAKEDPAAEVVFQKHRAWQQEDPEGYEVKQKQIEAVGEQAREMYAAEKAKAHPRAEYLQTLRYLSQPGPNAHPNAAPLLEAIRANASIDEIEKLKSSVVEAHGQALQGFLPIARQYGGGHYQAFIKSQPQTEQGKLEHDDAATGKRIAQVLSTTDDSELTIAFRSDPAKRSARQNEIVSAYAIGKASEATVTSQLALMHLSQSMEKGKDLDPEIQRNIEKIQDRGNPNTLERAEAMISGTLKHANNAVLSNSIKTGGNQARALSVLTLGFTDQNGGLPAYAAHSKVLASLQDPKAPRPTPEAVQAAQSYIGQYQAYLGKTLLGVDAVNMNDPETSLRLTVAMEKLGADLKSGEIKVESRADGSLAFTERNSYIERDTAYLNQNFTMRSHKEVATAMYEEARKGIQKFEEGGDLDLTSVRTALFIDTYRLYDTEKGKALINAFASGEYKGKEEELLTQVEELAGETAKNMAEHSDAIQAQMTRDFAKLPKEVAEKRLESLRNLNVIDTDGKLDVGYIMEGAAGAKYKYQADYKIYSAWSPEELLAGEKKMPDGTTARIEDGQERQDRYEARLMYTVASQYYVAQSLDNVGVEYAALKEQQKLLEAAGKPVPENLVLDLQMYAILNAEPGEKTHEQKVWAIDRLLERDTYISAPGRSELKLSAAGIMLDHLEHEHHDEGHAPVPVNVVTEEMLAEENAKASTMAPELIAKITPVLNAEGPINENEGAGWLDKESMDKFERQIFDAVKGLSADSRRTMFGSSDTLNSVNKGATGAEAVYSYNEIETALKRLGLNNVEKIADVNGNGFDAEDIRAALTPTAVLAGNGQGNGRS